MERSKVKSARDRMATWDSPNKEEVPRGVPGEVPEGEQQEYYGPVK